MKHYNLKTLQKTKTGYTDLFVLSFADTDFILNATTDIVLTALAVGDIVSQVLSEVRTEVAGPTATLSLGVTSAVTTFTAASDIATSTAVPYVAGKVAAAVGTGFIAATSAGAVTTAITNATSGVVANVVPIRYPVLATKNLIAETIISNTAVTAGEVWIWVSIDRKADRLIQVN